MKGGFLIENSRLIQKLDDFRTATTRLKEVMEAPMDRDYIYDAAIQRFEFTYELSWKLLMAYLSYNGLQEVASPRSAFREAFALGVLPEGQMWIDMLKDRNLTSHTYDEEISKKIYANIKGKYLGLFQALLQRLEDELLK